MGVADPLGSGCGCLIVVLVSVTNQFTILELVGVVLICVAAQFPGPAHLLFTACSAKLPRPFAQKREWGEPGQIIPGSLLQYGVDNWAEPGDKASMSMSVG